MALNCIIDALYFKEMLLQILNMKRAYESYISAT